MGELGLLDQNANLLASQLGQQLPLRLVAKSLASTGLLDYLAKKLGTQAARLLLARLVLGAFWIGLIFTLIIYILEDDALEKWCKRSSFRLAKNSKPFEEQEELKVLHSAFSEVL